jgi:hypothetical protein
VFYTQDVAERAASRHKTAQLTSPVRGLIRNQNLTQTKPGGAEILENWFPTSKGIITRGGQTKKATLAGTTAVGAILPYTAGGNSALFAANDDGIFNITAPATPTTVLTAADYTGTTITDGKLSYVQFSTSGGDFLVAVNGNDYAHIYNGTGWAELFTSNITALNYDAETAAFTVGKTIQGALSTHTAVIVKVIDNGTTGTLWLKSATGVFQNNETITETTGGTPGSATADGTATTQFAAITGTASNLFSHVWSHKNRLFFVKKNSLKFAYLPVDSIGGAAAEFNLGAVFSMGGTLLTGGTWSVDSGSGMDDLAVFITTEGEVAVYAGSDPGDAAEWSLQGVYRIPKPLGKNAMFKAGGDLAVATKAGLIPLSSAYNKAADALKDSAVSYPIEELWLDYSKERATIGWHLQPYSAHHAMLFVAPPTIAGQRAEVMVANMRTGAWTLFTGYDVRSMGVLGDNFYYGNSASVVYQGENDTGADDGVPYVCKASGSFDDLKEPGRQKVISMARGLFRSSFQSFNDQWSIGTDYENNFPSPPAATSNPPGSSLWGSGVWGTMVWGGSNATYTKAEWVSVEGIGYSIGWQLQLTCGNTLNPYIELAAVTLVYETGDVVA